MMSAARVAGLRYQKRMPKTKSPSRPTKGQHRSRLSLPVSQDDSSLIASSTTDKKSPCTSTLAVPDLLNGRKRAGSVPALKFTLAVAWNLKYTQVRALKQTWTRLCDTPRSTCKSLSAIVDHVFEKLDSKNKNVREIFYKAAFVDSMNERRGQRRSGASIATLRDHTHFFVSLVSQVIQHLDNDPQHIFEHIDKIGSYHSYLKQYGFSSKHWEKTAEYFIDSIVVQDHVRAFPEACKAWTIMIAALVDRLRAAPRRCSAISLRTEVSPLPKTMMRIKEAIQRRRIIQQLNEEWVEEQQDDKPLEDLGEDDDVSLDTDPFQLFANDLASKMTDMQVLEKLSQSEPAMRTIFYKSAFLSCIEDRVCQRVFPVQGLRCPRSRTISTLRDHAHLLVDFVDALLCTMFDMPVHKPVLDPHAIGLAHARLQPLGFERRFWNELGECFAEVLFMQDCVRAFPNAPSAWSLLSVSVTDAMFAAWKPLKALSTQNLSFDMPSSPPAMPAVAAIQRPILVEHLLPDDDGDDTRPASPSYSEDGSPAPSFSPSPLTSPLHHRSWRSLRADHILLAGSGLSPPREPPRLMRAHSDLPRRLLPSDECRSTIV